MPKLPKGMFKKRSSWYVRLRAAGKDRWICLGRDYEDACRRLREIRHGDLPAPKATVAEVAGRWMASYIKTARNEKGWKLATQRTTDFLIPFLGYCLIGKVTRNHLRDYRLWLEGKKLSRQTVAHILSDCRCLFSWCEDSGLVERSPVPRKLLPKIQERPPDRLTDEEIAVLVALPEPFGFAIRLGLGTGLRLSELFRAQASDVSDGVLLVSQTKSGRVRRIPLSPALASEIRTRIGRLAPFSSKSGQFARRVRELSGIKRFHVHQLRHSFACWWLEAGGSLDALQQLLGHSSVVTTQRYGKLSDHSVREQARRVMGGRTVDGSVDGTDSGLPSATASL